MNASSVFSFFLCALKFGRGWRSEAGNDSRLARNAGSSSGGSARAQQGLQLLQFDRRWVVAREPCRAAKLVDKREQRAVLVVRRAEIAQADMRFGPEALFQLGGQSRLADAGLAGNQHNLALARFGARPAPLQQIDLLVAVDQPDKRWSVQCFESARNGVRVQYLPNPHWRSDSLDRYSTEIAIFEEVADQTARPVANNDRTGRGQGLQTGGEVGGLSDDRSLLCRSFTNQIADDHQSGGDPDARLELNGFDIKAIDSLDHAQSCKDRPLCLILMSSRVAEIDEHAVAHVPGNKPLESTDDIGDGPMICGNDLAQILGIKPRGELSGADQIAEHYSQLPALGISRSRCIGDSRLPCGSDCYDAERSDRIQQLTPVTD